MVKKCNYSAEQSSSKNSVMSLPDISMCISILVVYMCIFICKMSRKRDARQFSLSYGLSSKKLETDMMFNQKR